MWKQWLLNYEDSLVKVLLIMGQFLFSTVAIFKCWWSDLIINIEQRMEDLRKKCPYSFLIIIVAIIIFIYFCVIKLLILDIHPWSDTSTAVFLIFYNLIFVLLAWSIIQTIRTDPGRVPIQWGFGLNNPTRKYCLICHVYKPERTHHCSSCSRCVLNMDHHW